MTIWADEMIGELKKYRGQLQQQKSNLDKNDPHEWEVIKSKNSMIADMSFVLEWLETGRQPGNYRGADKRGVYQQRSFISMEFIPDITEQLEEGPKQLYMTNEEKIILADIFASLSHRERECYILHEAQRLSMGRIAEELEISKASVQTHITRARKKVQKRVS